MMRVTTAVVGVLMTAGWSFGNARTAEIKRLQGQVQQLKKARHQHIVAAEANHRAAGKKLRGEYDALQAKRAAVRREENAALANASDQGTKDKIRAEYGRRRRELRILSDKVHNQMRQNSLQLRIDLANIRTQYDGKIRELELRIRQIQRTPARKGNVGKAKPPKLPKVKKPKK
jgi:hypothetical protein